MDTIEQPLSVDRGVNNTDPFGGLAVLGANTRLGIRRSVMSDNTNPNRRGGGLTVVGGRVVVDSCILSKNISHVPDNDVAPNDGGGLRGEQAHLIIRNSQFDGNSVGGIYATDSTFVMEDCSITNNSGGDEIAAGVDAQLTIEQSVVAHATSAGSDGGGGRSDSTVELLHHRSRHQLYTVVGHHSDSTAGNCGAGVHRHTAR
ncbi:MAG: right-handed parallel beta-helix repeat-containing protein [Candidatus Latescibacteria bacterium]|nr:right-handed parallel beta-helix repeat-containing protein [Candidatus Latescibacterota bacterium]